MSLNSASLKAIGFVVFVVAAVAMLGSFLLMQQNGRSGFVGQQLPVASVDLPVKGVVDVRLDQLMRGKTTLMTLWSDNCPPCIHELPILKEFFATQRPSLQYVSVLIDDRNQFGSDTFPAHLQGLLKKYALPFDVYLDHQMSVVRAFNIFAVPEHFLVDANGMIIDHRVGSVTSEDLQAFERRAAR